MKVYMLSIYKPEKIKNNDYKKVFMLIKFIMLYTLFL